MPKRSIREKLLAARRHCSLETCLHLSLLIQGRFLDSEAYRQARSLALYSPVMNEVQTESVARRALADGKRLVYPRVVGSELHFAEVSALGALVPGAFGIPEPPGGCEVPLAEIDLVIIPGVAFDTAGHRLGYGKGYYDRALAAGTPRPARIGFCYEFQLIANLPAAAHDIRMTQLVTEQRLLHFPSTEGDR